MEWIIVGDVFINAHAIAFFEIRASGEFSMTAKRTVLAVRFIGPNDAEIVFSEDHEIESFLNQFNNIPRG